MAQFISTFSAEVSGSVICSVLKAIPSYENRIIAILAKYNLENPEPDIWYNMQDYLGAFKEIAMVLGPHLLFSIGKSFPLGFSSNGEVNSLEAALENLDNFYHVNHRGNNIGYYKLLSYSTERKEAIIECKNPYPCYLDRGVLTALSQQFKPRGANMINVELDMHRPSRLNGSDVSYYNINWI